MSESLKLPAALEDHSGELTPVLTTKEHLSWSEELVRKIAMDVGKEIVAHIEHAYPEMFTVVAEKSAKLSIRNTTYNAIISAVEAANRGESEEAIKRHDRQRRTLRKLRKAKTVEEVQDVMKDAGY